MDSQIGKFGLLTIILADLIGYPGIGLGLAYFAHSKWGAPLWLLMPTTLIGLVLAFYQIYRISKREL